MGRKIFVSYKFGDRGVQKIGENGTPRDYVTKLEDVIGKSNIYKGESEGDDLSYLSDEQIWEHLKDKIADSSITIVMISPNMREPGKQEKHQWIPREISYSLKEMPWGGQTKRTNAVLAVVLPDINGSYEYYITAKKCCPSGCTTYDREFLFEIINENIFNLKIPDKRVCAEGSNIHYGDYSYILSVRWGDFMHNIEKHLDNAATLKENIGNYEVRKDLS
ncbi:MAG: hypothetical protein ACRCUS_06765 [Anaerovoracaceae bacterium]